MATLGEQNERLKDKLDKATVEINLLRRELPKEKVEEIKREVALLTKEA